MKKFLCVFISAVLALSLTACGSGEKAFDPAADAKALLETAGVFSETLTEIDRSTACALYGIDENTVTGSAIYGATGSAEELAIFTLSDETAAQTAAKQLGYRVEDRKEELTDYMPAELPKLDKAVVETRGNSVLLVIAADYAGVDELLKG